jgi:transcriptional regulator with XRE-family HTH domain
MRRIRIECGVSLNEMERLTGISHQYYSEIELSEKRKSPGALALAQKAFEAVIAERRDAEERLSKVYSENKDLLLEFEPFAPCEGEAP